MPFRIGIHQRCLRQRHERARCRVEGDKRNEQFGEVPRESHRRERRHEQHSAAQHHEPPVLNQPNRKLKQPADKQRKRRQQPDLPVAEPERMLDPRQRRTLDTISKLVGKLHRERNPKHPASIKVHSQILTTMRHLAQSFSAQGAPYPPPPSTPTSSCHGLRPTCHALA
jgi:hypothetical protein